MRIPALARCLLIISMSLIFSATRAQMSGIYTINPAQAAGGTNFQTFNQAVTALKAGISGAVTINVAPNSGPYIEQIHLDHTIKSSASRPVIFNCNGVTLTFLAKDADQHAGIMIDSADYITIDSLIILPQGVNSDEFGYGIHLLHDADNNTIKRCKILNQHHAGLEIQRNDNIIINGSLTWGTDDGNSSCDSNIITRNTISGGYTGITLSSNGEGASMIRGNQITDNIITDFENAGILLNGNAENTLINGNDLTQPNAIFCKGIILLQKNLSTMISNNRIHNINNIYGLPVSGIFICSEAGPGQETVIANNLIYDIYTEDEQNGIEIRYGSPAAYVKILHNTIVLDKGGPSHMFATFGINIGFNSNNISIFNNIIQVLRTTTTENYGLFVESYTPGLESDNNDWHIAGPTATVNAIANLEGLQCITLADWQGATGMDLSSAEVDPLFADRAAGNLKPGEGAIDNKGRVTEITKDITGADRNSSAPDVGAFEFDGPPCFNPIAGTANGLPNTTTCEGQPVILTLSGNSAGTGQTYQWQSDVNASGSFNTMVNAPQAAPAYEIRPVATLYYRAAVTCGTKTVYSNVIPIMVNPALPAGDYSIDASKPASPSNFQSLQDALNAMHCGIRGHVVFHLAPGTYNEQITIQPIPGAGPNKTITFNGHGASMIFAPFISEERAVIKLDGADYITIDSINIEIPTTDNDAFGFGIQLTNNADHNTIRNNNIKLNTTSYSFNYAGITMSASNENAANVIDGSFCDSNAIYNNTVTGGYYGITCTSSEIEGLSDGNRITNNTIKDSYAYGVYAANANGLVIEGNELSRTLRDNSYAEYSGIFLSSRNVNLRVSGNRLHDLSTGDVNSAAQIAGINFLYSYSTADAPQVVANNLLYHLNGKGLQQGLLFQNASYVQFFHNTLNLADKDISSPEPTRGLAVFGATSAGLVFRNNNITIDRLGTAAKHCVFIGPGTPVFTSDNNNYFVGTSPNSFVAHRSGTDYATLNDWTSSSSVDAQSLSVDPAYKNIAQDNYEPTAVNMENKGSWVGVPKDIIGKSRNPSAPDIGAFEYSVCTVFPAVAAVNDSQIVCTNTPVTFGVKNPQSNVIYTWHTASTGGTPFFTGSSYAVDKLSASVEYFIEAHTPEGCYSTTRARAKAEAMPPLPDQLNLAVDSVSTLMVRFKWQAVPGATAYQVSRDGVKFSDPSSGPLGLTHEFTDLKPNDTVGMVVRALGTIDCQRVNSARIVAKTNNNPFYIPNTFTPNGNGQNDDFRVYCSVAKSMHLMVFNQWGEKVFETTNLNTGWDGTFKGKPQPVGVYVYAAKLTFNDNTEATQRGTLNLVR